jgi:hypothetical protein
MRQASPDVTRRVRILTVVSWLGGAASVLPFAEEWFDLSGRLGNLALLAAVASAVALGFAVHSSSGLDRVLAGLAGPPDPPARALVLVAVIASAGALAMLALTRFGRAHAAYGRPGVVGLAGVFAVGVLSVAVAWLQVQQYV